MGVRKAIRQYLPVCLEIRGLFRLRRRNLALGRYVIDDKKKLAYLFISKVACSSIKTTFIEPGIPDDHSVHEIVDRIHRLSAQQQDYFTFAFVRNPFDRLYSCYKNKFVDKSGTHSLDQYPFNYFGHIASFEQFVKKVVRIPDIISDQHFMSQYFHLYKNNVCLVDSVGRFESLAKDFEPIRQKYQLGQLEHYNKSQSKVDEWKSHYTEELAALVYRRYKKDFKLFYPHAYQELLTYIQEKPIA